MKLLGSHTSPYARKARLVLLEKNIPHEYLIDPPSEPGSQVSRFNPLGRIPALVLDSGECVFDSVVIAEYVDTLNDTPILIPRHNALARMRARRWEALADGIMDSAIVVRMESIRLADKQDAATLALHNDNISRALAHAATQLGTRDWVEGDAIGLGDLALISALLYLDLRQPGRDWRGVHPDLARWFETMAARPSVQIATRV